MGFFYGVVVGICWMSIFYHLTKARNLRKFEKELAEIIIKTHHDFHLTDYHSQEWHINAAAVQECREIYDKWAKEVIENGKRKK